MSETTTTRKAVRLEATNHEGSLLGKNVSPTKFESGKESGFAFADIPCEMTKQQYEDFTRGRGTALHAINDYEDADNALPEPEDHLRIENA